jgi:hypothetical protein
MLIERPRLTAILEIARERLHAMREFMGHHVERPREPERQREREQRRNDAPPAKANPEVRENQR